MAKNRKYQENPTNWKRQLEKEYRNKMDLLIKNDPNAITSSEYEKLTRNYNKAILSSSPQIEDESFPSSRNRIEPRTAISKIISKNDIKKEDSYFAGLIKNLIYYALVALAFWLVKKYL